MLGFSEPDELGFDELELDLDELDELGSFELDELSSFELDELDCSELDELSSFELDELDCSELDELSSFELDELSSCEIMEETKDEESLLDFDELGLLPALHANSAKQNTRSSKHNNNLDFIFPPKLFFILIV